MGDGNGTVPPEGREPDGQEPGERGERPIRRLLEELVRTMTAMEDGRQPATALDPVATPLAARRIQSIVLAERAQRRRTSTPRPRTVPAVVRASASFHPSAGVTEGVVLVREEQHTRAYCVRLERYGPDWRVVELARPDTTLRPVVTRASREGRLSTPPTDPYGSSRCTRPPIHLDGVDQDANEANEATEGREEGRSDVTGPEDGPTPA